MSDATFKQFRVPSSLVLGFEEDVEGGLPVPKPALVRRSDNILSELAAAMTWKLCKEGCVTREDLPEEAMVSVVRQLLA